MFTDMVGYTALMQSNEEQAMEVLQRHNRLLRPFFPKFHGREVKAIGDSFLVEFESALDALRCAAEIQSFLRDYNYSSRDEWKINLRVGIHLGDVIHREGDVFGDAVNIASRIEPLAEPGGVVMSEQVYDQVRNKSELEFVSMGEKSLKNVSSPVPVYTVRIQGTGARPEVPEAGARRIAVLPFVSMSPDPNDEFFADGLTEELIDRLCQVKELAVIARTSVMNYKNKEKNASQIGRELRAGALVEGSIRKAGNKIRVTAQLINASTEEHLWSSKYDRDLSDIFAVQTDIAENVAGALELKLLAKPEAPPTRDLEAYTMYLKAKQLAFQGISAGTRQARALLEEVVARDPKFAKGYALLVATIWTLASSEEDYPGAIARAEAAAKKALELAPESAESHVALAMTLSANDRFEEAESELEEAVQVNPNSSDALTLLGFNHYSFGRLEEGLSTYRKAFSLDPLSLHAGMCVADGLRMLGRVDEAIEFIDGLKSSSPDSPRPHLELSACYAQSKKFAEAEREMNIASSLDPGSLEIKLNQGWLYAMMGKKTEAEGALASLMGAPLTLRDAALFQIKGMLGDLDSAFDALMRMADRHAWYAFVKADPLFEPLRRDLRFTEFCRKVGLPV